MGIDHRWFGVGLGGVAGALMGRGNFSDQPILPSASLRLGPRDILYAEAMFLQHGSGPFPGVFARAGLVGTGRRWGTEYQPLQIAFGVSTNGFYIAPRIGFAKHFAAEIFGAYGDTEHWEASVRLRAYAPVAR